MSLYRKIILTIEEGMELRKDEASVLKDELETIEKIDTILNEAGVPWESTSNHIECGPGYEQTFYVYSWFENGEINMIDFVSECC